MLTALWSRSDEYVVRRVLSGRRNDFGVLVRRYLPAVLAVVRGILKNPADADDVSQESFLTAYQKLDTLKAQEKFAGWLMAIARNTALNWQRGHGREVPLEEGIAEALHGDVPAPDRKEMQQMLHATLMDLDPDTRELLLMHYYGGCSLREIAQIKGIKRLAAGKRLQRAREALGAEFLKLVPEAPAASTLKKRARTITTAVLAAGAAWKTVPAYGMVATLAIGAAKFAVVGVGVAVLSAGALFAAPSVMGWKPDLPVPKTMAAKPATPEKAVLPAAVESEAAALNNNENAAGEGEGETPNEEPLLPYSSVLVTPLGQPIGNAEVIAERITWAQQELPPPETERWSATADDNGNFTFPGLPPGKYSITAYTRVFGGASDITVTKTDVDKYRDIKMYPLIRSYGLLQDSKGKPVAGAAIYPISHELFPEQEFGHVRMAGVRATSDEQGRFAFAGIIPGRWRLYVVSPGHEPFYAESFPCFGLQRRVVIQDPGMLAGRIVDENGKPRANVKGTAHAGKQIRGTSEGGPSHRMQYEFVSNEEGLFQVAPMPPAIYAFTVNDAVLTLTRPNATVEVKSGVTSEVELAVRPGGTVYGRVLNAKTREGIPEMKAYLWSVRGETGMSRTVTTGAAGDYIFTGLPAGTYQIECIHNRAYPQMNREPLTVDVKLGETVEDKDILIAPPLRLAGHVVDINGKPAVADVYVQGMNQYDHTTSETDGSFSAAFTDTAKATVTALTKTMRSEAVEVDPANLPQELLLHLTVKSGSRIEGTVVDGKMKPLYNAEVLAGSNDPRGQVLLAGNDRRVTDSLGRFVLEGLPAGSYSLTAIRQYRSIGATTVEVGEDVTVQNVVIQEANAGNLTIEGVVSYPNGLPCPFAVVSANTQQATAAGALGRFTFKDLAEGQYDIYAISPGYSPTIVHGVAAGTKDLKIALMNYVTLAGSVVDARLGAPVKEFTVSYRAMTQVLFDMNGIDSGQRGFSDPLGKFRIEKVIAFPIHVEVRAAGYATWSAEIADPVGGQETMLAVELQAGARVTGTVRNEAGEPVASAQASASGAMPVTTDAAGTFAVDGLAAGQEIPLTVSCPRYATEHLTVTPGTGGPLNIVLRQSGRLIVHASLDGQSLTNFAAAYRVPGSENRLDSAMTRAGELVFENIPPGETEVVVEVKETGKNAGGTANVTVVAGQDTLVDVTASVLAGGGPL
jgi:RNA polymerase sigma-70 factor (ECF subfamily)